MRKTWLFAVMVAFQAFLLVGLAAAEELGLSRGEEVTLQTVPVDPRDLLRGDYVTLAYEITTPRQPAAGRFDVGDEIWVELVQVGDEWIDQALSSERRDGWDVGIRGTVVSTRPLRVEYGIEAYFVPEGRGHEVEGARDVGAVVSIGRDGKARLRYLIVDGERWAH